MLATQKRFARPFEPIGELVAMALDVLVDSLFDELGLLEPGMLAALEPSPRRLLNQRRESMGLQRR